MPGNYLFDQEILASPPAGPNGGGGAAKTFNWTNKGGGGEGRGGKIRSLIPLSSILNGPH